MAFRNGPEQKQTRIRDYLTTSKSEDQRLLYIRCSRPTMNSLPSDVLERIAKQLGSVHVAAMRQTNRWMYAATACITRCTFTEMIIPPARLYIVETRQWHTFPWWTDADVVSDDDLAEGHSSQNRLRRDLAINCLRCEHLNDEASVKHRDDYATFMAKRYAQNQYAPLREICMLLALPPNRVFELNPLERVARRCRLFDIKDASKRALRHAGGLSALNARREARIRGSLLPRVHITRSKEHELFLSELKRLFESSASAFSLLNKDQRSRLLIEARRIPQH